MLILSWHACVVDLNIVSSILDSCRTCIGSMQSKEVNLNKQRMHVTLHSCAFSCVCDSLCVHV